MASVVVSNALSMVAPLFVKKIIDEVLPQGDQGALAFYSFAVIGVHLLSGVFGYILRYANEFVYRKSVYDIRKDLYKSLLDQSFSFYDSSQTGQLIARSTGDIREIGRFFGLGLRAIIDAVLRFIIAFMILVTMDWKLAVLSFATAPLVSLIVSRYAQKIGPVWTIIRSQYGKLTSIIQENITGIRVVKGFSQEKSEGEKFSVQSQNYMDRTVAQAKLRAYYISLSDFVAGANILFILWYGGNQMILGNLTLGSWMAFNIYAWQLSFPVRFLGFMTGFYKRALAAANRVFEVMDAKPEVEDKENAVELVNVQGNIRFENVSFSYDKDNTIFRNINLDVKSGETVAILGATGSGKSSFISLIPRFYDAASGRIMIDGQDVRNIKLSSLRKSIAIVQQEPFIFSTTFGENIAYGKEDATIDEIVKASKAAQLHDFISSLPEGYDTDVGERGVDLSGGQKQRLAIARALLTDAKIIIFDASTSSVDTETEYEIQRALETVLQNRTTLIITQRLSTVKNADRMVVLDKGEIVEDGTHDQLMDKKGLYYRLYQTQLEEAAETPSRRD